MRDYAISARDRLLALSRAQSLDFQQVLLRYARERFLYRLSASEYRDRCLLKGATLLSLWMADPYRSTRDLDLLSYGPSDKESVRKLVASICSMPCPEDGLVFDLASLSVEEIRAENEYGGQRARVDAGLAHALLHMQIDIGFGDVVEPVEGEYPVLLHDLPAPRIAAYPREYVIAEKFEAMLELGRRNSRMKDFHDIWALSRSFNFTLGRLATAVSRCLGKREIRIDSDPPEPLTTDFYQDEGLHVRWNAYRTKGSFRSQPPESFCAVGAALLDFLSPLWQAIITKVILDTTWSPGGPWEEKDKEERREEVQALFVLQGLEGGVAGGDTGGVGNP